MLQESLHIVEHGPENTIASVVSVFRVFMVSKVRVASSDPLFMSEHLQCVESVQHRNIMCSHTHF